MKRLLIGLCVLFSACGSGRLDPFDRARAVPAPVTENCGAVDTDASKSFVPAALVPVAATTQQTTAGGFQIDWTAYPLPYADAKVWSTWSKGLIAKNGHYYSAIGDGDSAGDANSHDGNTLLYEYDPATRTVRAVGDVLTAYGQHVTGENGYGKIQGQIGEGPCGLLYMHTYWGSPSAVVYTGNYQGDLLLRYNPWTKSLQSLGVKIPQMGVPALTMWRAGGLIYGEANTPVDPKQVVFWAYDIASDTVTFESPRRQYTARNVAVDATGRAYYVAPPSSLYRFDPATGSEELLGVSFSGGGWLRTSTRAAGDGTLILVTAEPDAAYLFDPATSRLTLLATLPRPIADIEMDPSERVAYFVPVGLDAGTGLPLYELDRTTGAIRALVDLGAAIEAAGGSRPQGSYSINITPDGRTIYIAANSGQPDGFGVPELIAVHLPDSALP